MLCQTKEEACRSGERILYNQARARNTLTKVIIEATLKSWKTSFQPTTLHQCWEACRTSEKNHPHTLWRAINWPKDLDVFYHRFDKPTFTPLTHRQEHTCPTVGRLKCLGRLGRGREQICSVCSAVLEAYGAARTLSSPIQHADSEKVGCHPS